MLMIDNFVIYLQSNGPCCTGLSSCFLKISRMMMSLDFGGHGWFVVDFTSVVAPCKDLGF